jgi:hypothetical protein
MNYTFLGQVGQEGCWVPIDDFGHRVGADALILADKSIYSWQVFVKMLDEENETEFWNSDIAAHRLWLPSYLACPAAAFCYT